MVLGVILITDCDKYNSLIEADLRCTNTENDNQYFMIINKLFIKNVYTYNSLNDYLKQLIKKVRSFSQAIIQLLSGSNSNDLSSHNSDIDFFHQQVQFCFRKFLFTFLNSFKKCHK